MFVVTVDFEIKPDFEHQFLEAMLKNARASLTKEEGCLQFDVCHQKDDPSRIFLYEVYVSEAAFKTHMTTNHFAVVNSETDGMVANKVIKTFDTVINR